MSMYIYNMPFGKYLDLQRILDVNEQWKDLAKQIGTFTQEDIEYISLDAYKPGQSPTNHLLIRWGHSNATVKDLFRHLKAMNNKRALNVLRGLVPDEYFHVDKKGRADPISFPAGTDTSELPSCPESSIKHGNQLDVVPAGTPVPPYQSQLSWRNDPARQPTQSECSEYLQDQSRNEIKSSSGHVFVGNPGSLHDAVLDLTPRFTEEELRVATKNFSPHNEIGHGAFGVVYYGLLKRLRHEVAIKVLKKEDKHELEALCRCRHNNIIQLLGYCQSSVNSYLVYDYMKNGSLLDRILRMGGRPPLSWTQRINILIGAAKAVGYLHSLDPPIIHGDIKSANILLDANFEAKVADFGLAKQANSGQSMKVTHVSQRNEKVYGSIAYLPDEYLEDYTKLRKEVDIFSFGIVIFETCLGVKATDATRISNGQYKQVKDLMNDYRNVKDDAILETKLKDPLCQNWPTPNWLSILRIGFQCTVSSWRKRPSMDKVLDALENAWTEAKRLSHLQFGDHVVPSSAINQHVSYSSESHQPDGLQCQNLPVDELEKISVGVGDLTMGSGGGDVKKNITLDDLEEATLMSQVSQLKVGETSSLDKIEAKVTKFEQLKNDIRIAEEIVKNNLMKTDEAWILAENYDRRDDVAESKLEQSTDPKAWYECLCDNSQLDSLTEELPTGGAGNDLAREKVKQNLYVKPLKWVQASASLNSGGGQSQELLYLKTKSDESVSVKKVMPGTSLMTKESHLCTKDMSSYHPSAGGLYCPNSIADSMSNDGTVDESFSISSEVDMEQKKKKKLPAVIQAYRTEADSTSGDAAEEGMTEDTLCSIELKRKQKKKIHPLIEEYRLQKTELDKSSSQLADDMPPVREAEPVEHIQSLTESEGSSYVCRSFQDSLPGDHSPAETQSMALYANENAFSVVTSGMSPTPSLTSPPLYQVAKH